MIFPSESDKRPVVQHPEALPMTMEEVQARGWESVDIVFITGDAYVDHPSFATGLLARVLEAHGFRIAVLSQPDWHSAEPFRQFGPPRLGFCISAGNMDSMINHYTANKKIRNEDAYSPDGVIGRRPDRATLAYCQRAKEAFNGIPIITGGVESSLRRLAHYDYWSEKVRRSILMDSKANLLSYGMGESSLLEIFRRLDAGEPIQKIRNTRGTVYRLGMLEDLPEESATVVHLPSYEEVAESPEKFAEMTRLIWQNLNPFNAATLVQEHGEEAVVVNPPSLPLTQEEMDWIYQLPFTRLPHPFYGNKKIPAFEMIQNSVTIHRGCFGGCSFCSIVAHQGKFIQSRSESSIIQEIRKIADMPNFSGTISDLGAPTANMYRLGCTNEEAQKACRRPSCLFPGICSNLNTDHKPVIELMKKVRDQDGIRNVFIASGVRTDLAQQSPEYIHELIRYHIGGHLKTAPEHVDDKVLELMQKPSIENYENFCGLFDHLVHENKKELYLVPYLIAGFPGCDIKAMVGVAEYLKEYNIRPEQVQDFIPTPFSIATCMYYTGIHPLTGEKVYVAKGLRERRLQRALLFYYNPEYYHDVKSALREAEREDLIGNGPACLIPPYPPKATSLRQTSRIKRLKRKAEQEKERIKQTLQNSSSRQDDRFSYSGHEGRFNHRDNRGYRGSARTEGSRSGYGSRVDVGNYSDNIPVSRRSEKSFRKQAEERTDRTSFETGPGNKPDPGRFQSRERYSGNRKERNNPQLQENNWEYSQNSGLDDYRRSGFRNRNGLKKYPDSNRSSQSGDFDRT
ncbi:MAG: YgiQ family radical SAM protein, partial [Thermoguttaceae bacterium]|nr:YgiQ family radical SAM protein [Thermoguttaceae bacterium]